ncbi:MAG: threonine aldolase family protein [Alphaproteobacteria bacterium]|nr:threonine aldolase family protein [Alphaproteobacteria bacterium]
MTEIEINLYSDTQTRPTPAMRKAMADAPVGDEQRGDDPTVNRLCERVAELLGQEAAVFLPSGTMCNEIAILVHCRPGDEILADKSSHIINSEGAGPAALAGAAVQPLDGARGIFSAAQVAAAARPESRYAPRTRLVSVEQTANMAGGTVWPLEAMRAVVESARNHDLALHMDGARLMNAVIASDTPADAFAGPFDSAWIDLSKGLGCPVGGVLAGSAAFIAEAWRWKQRMGGAMRQAGILAAAGLYALDYHVERLADDHANAKLLAERLVEVPKLRVDPDLVESNMVFIELDQGAPSAAEFNRRLATHGVCLSEVTPTRLRAVTHLDVSRAQVEQAAAAMAMAILEAA